MNARLVSVKSEPALAAKKTALLSTLRNILRQSFELRYAGASYEKQARAQGYADGFMCSLLESGVVAERELLSFVQDVRRGVDGPAVTEVQSSDDATCAA